MPSLPSFALPSAPPELDTLQLYLVVVNVASLIVHALHYVLLSRTGQERVALPARNLITVAGGVGATLLCYLLWDRRTTKQNSWPHVLTADALLGWGVALAFVYARPFDLQVTLANARAAHDLRILYGLGAVSVLALVLYGIDKWRATKDRWRIPEALLLGVALLGGSPGALLGMLLFHHKIRSPQFAVGVPLMLAAQLAWLAWFVNAGLV